jgi:hypothetical protein
MVLRELLLQHVLLLDGAIILAASEPYSICNRTCGSLLIPYPLGSVSETSITLHEILFVIEYCCLFTNLFNEYGAYIDVCMYTIDY